jgi:phosphoribosylformylglycinamidine cyclo-ligase
MTKTPMDYQSAGVDYDKIDPLKIEAQRAARETSKNLARHKLTEVDASRGESAYVIDIGDCYLAAITECLGTKVLVADAMRAVTGKTYFDALAQDTVAMAVNDLITVGATPVSVHAYWAAGSSNWFDDAQRTRDLVAGWQKACDISGVSWGGGETPCLGGVVHDSTIDLAASSNGLIRPKERLTLGDKLANGDMIILVESSGIHANGVSLARKLAEKLPKGYATPISDGRLYGEALLDPTVLYVPATEALFAAGVIPHYTVNVTGHGWRKLMRHPGAFTYRMNMIPPVPPVLAFIQKETGIDDVEAYGTFNMGAGFAFFVAAGDVRKALAALEQTGLKAWQAGIVEQGIKQVVIEPLKVTFAASDLHLRA